MDKQSSNNFHFEVTQRLGITSGYEITLSYVTGEKSLHKMFDLAGERNKQNLIEHMNSLTDDQCASFFGMRWDEKSKRYKMRGEK